MRSNVFRESYLKGLRAAERIARDEAAQYRDCLRLPVVEIARAIYVAQTIALRIGRTRRKCERALRGDAAEREGKS